MTLTAGTRLGPYDPPSRPRRYGVTSPPSLALAIYGEMWTRR
jgi:hypothetical protein